MQGQRSTVESFSEAFEFEHGSSSNSVAIDQNVYWTNVLSPGDPRNLPDYVLSPNDTNMSYANVVSHDSGSLNGWNLGGSSSVEPMINQTSHDEAKMEHGWTSSLTANAGAGPRLEERRFEAANMLSLENVDINLNSNQIGPGQLFLQNPNSNDAPQNSDHNAGLASNGGQVLQAGICHLYNPFGSEAEQIPSASGSTNSCGTSTVGVEFFPEDVDGRPGGSLDGRRISGKRKNIEGVPGQSSGSANPSCFQQTENCLLHNSAQHNSTSSLNITSSSDNLSVINPPEEQLNPRFDGGTRGAASDCLSSVSVVGNAESSQRNFRMRINPAHQRDSSPPNLWPSGNSNRRPNVWPSHQPSSLLIPFNQPLETRPAVPGVSSQSQSHVPSIPGLPRIAHPFPWNGVPNSRIGSSSNSPVISSERSATLREEVNTRSMPRNNISEHPMFVPATDVRHLAQDPTNWSLANANISIPGNVASTSRAISSSGVHPPVAPTWVPHQNPPSQYPQTLSEFVRQSLPSASSDPGVQTNNFLPQRSGHSSSSQEMVPQPGAGSRAHQPPYLRSAFLMDRRNDVQGAPLSLRTLAGAREGRSRLISEHIRNALDLMRRGENIRFEDVLILDQSIFYGGGGGGADLHDRHRDMRLDVDNMSYEELLALEERIGNVSTGLSEETILKCLKQRKYLSITITISMEVEPCCICQEEYVDGEELGTLDCGHDFHTACIKQWLMHKNLCPVCKTTALVT